MTELLKQIMDEHADRLEDGGPDLGAILNDGRARARRRRAGVGAAGLVVAATAAAIVVPMLVGGAQGDRQGTEVAGSSVPAMSWAEGSTIHAAGETVDVGHEIHAYVATDRGYAVVDPDGVVWSWTSGETSRVGQVRDLWDRVLVADGDHVAWLDVSTDEPKFVVLDQGTGDRVAVAAEVPDVMKTGAARADDGNEQVAGLDDAYVEVGVAALDERLLWVSDTRGVLAVDFLDPHLAVEVFAARSEGYVVDDAESGRVLLSRSETEDASADFGDETVVSPIRLDPSAPLPVRGGDLAPGARHVMSENSASSSDDFTLVDLERDAKIEVDANSEYDFFTGFAWIDADSFVAVGMDETGNDDEEWTAELLTCVVSTATCEVWAGGPGSFDETTVGFQLPIGEHIG